MEKYLSRANLPLLKQASRRSGLLTRCCGICLRMILGGCMSLKLAVPFIIASLAFGGSMRADTNFLAAADFSDLAFFESRGVTYKDGGQVQDGLQILKNHGINCVRLRLWTSSQAQAASDPYNHINNTNYTVPLAVRVKNSGLPFSLHFHYSHSFSRPPTHATPPA